MKSFSGEGGEPFGPDRVLEIGPGRHLETGDSLDAQDSRPAAVHETVRRGQAGLEDGRRVIHGSRHQTVAQFHGKRVAGLGETQGARDQEQHQRADPGQAADSFCKFLEIGHLIWFGLLGVGVEHVALFVVEGEIHAG